MPELIEIAVYRFDELDDDAKEKARSRYREAGVEDDWYAFVFDDFAAICTMVGVDLNTRPVRLYGGGTGAEPAIHFTGFWSQGDGACFEGHYAYAVGATDAMRRHAPQDADLHAIADTLQAAQRSNFYQLSAAIGHRGRYHHEHSMMIAVERDSPTGQPAGAGADEIVAEALRDLARWLYRRLEREHAYLTSDAVVDETVRLGGEVFTADGDRFPRGRREGEDGRAG